MEIDPQSCQDSSPIDVHLSQKFMKVLIPTNISMVLVFNRKLSVAWAGATANSSLEHVQ